MSACRSKSDFCDVKKGFLMDDLKVSKLKRGELYEMLLEVSRENERLKEKLAETEKRLEEKEEELKAAVSVAETADRLEDSISRVKELTENLLSEMKSRRSGEDAADKTAAERVIEKNDE